MRLRDASATCGLFRDGGVLGPPATASDLPSGHVPGAIAAEIRFLGAAPRVRPRQPHDRPVLLVDLFAAVVANENCSPCHDRNATGNGAGTMRPRGPAEFGTSGAG